MCPSKIDFSPLTSRYLMEINTISNIAFYAF